MRYIKLYLLLLSAAALYSLLFLLLPLLFPHWFPQSNEATAVLLILTALFSTAGVLLLDLKLWHWLCADMLFGLWIAIYDGEGLYGFGLRGVLLDGAIPRYNKTLALIMILGLLLLMIALQGLSLLLKSKFREN